MNQHDSTNDETPINPYSSTHTDQSRFLDTPEGLSDVTVRGLVGQVQILGVLIIVQGACVSLAGLVIGLYAVFMPQFIAAQQLGGQGGNAPPLPPNFAMSFGIIGGIVFFLVLTIGLLTVFAGVRTMQFRSRKFSIVMMCVGLLTITTCYCLPTQIALSTYGLIVLLNAPVRDAFRFAEQGHSAREIQRAYLAIP